MNFEVIFKSYKFSFVTLNSWKSARIRIILQARSEFD